MSERPINLIRNQLYLPPNIDASKELDLKTPKLELTSQKEEKELEIEGNTYEKQGGILVPKETMRGIIIADQNELTKHSPDMLQKSSSTSELIDETILKIIAGSDDSEKENITEFFSRLSDLQIVLVEKSDGPKKSKKLSFSPLVMNRETYSKYNYQPLHKIKLKAESQQQLEQCVKNSIRPEQKIFNSPMKRFGLRFLANSIFIDNFDKSQITEKVIKALSKDREAGAQGIYQHYLCVEHDNLSDEQKQEVLEILSKSNKLSSHLAQTILFNSPELGENINPKEFPRVENFKQLKALFKSDIQPGKLAMNQKNLVPEELSEEDHFGIEIEMKLQDEDQTRTSNSPIKQALSPYHHFIELGKDGYNTIAELRTLNYGFPLNAENQKNLFNVINEFHKSEDLCLFLSNHIHVDQGKSMNATGNLLSFTVDNNGGRTWETKSLDCDSVYLDSQNRNLYHSFNMSALIDQMVILNELKDATISPASIYKAKQLQEISNINLNSSLLLVQAVSSGKNHILPNIFRLIEFKKDYIETECDAHLGEDKLKIDFFNNPAYKISLDSDFIDYLESISPEEQLAFSIAGEDIDNDLTLKLLTSKNISYDCKKKFIDNMDYQNPDQHALTLFTKLKESHLNNSNTEQESDKQKLAYQIARKLQITDITETINQIMNELKTDFPDAVEQIIYSTSLYYANGRGWASQVSLNSEIIDFLENLKDSDPLHCFDIECLDINSDLSIKLLLNERIPYKIKVNFISNMDYITGSDKLKPVLEGLKELYEKQQVDFSNDTEANQNNTKNYRNLISKLCGKLDASEISTAKNELLEIDGFIRSEVIWNTCAYYQNNYDERERELTKELFEFMQKLESRNQAVFDLIAKTIDEEMTYEFLSNSKISTNTKRKYIFGMPFFTAKDTGENLQNVLRKWKDYVTEIEALGDQEKFEKADKEYKQLVFSLCDKLDATEISSAKNELLNIDDVITTEIVNITCSKYREDYFLQNTILSEELIEFMENLDHRGQSSFDLAPHKINDELSFKFLINPQIKIETKADFIAKMPSFKTEDAGENLKNIFIRWRDKHRERIKDINDPEQIKAAERSYKKLVQSLCKKLDASEISKAKNDLLEIDNVVKSNLLENTYNYYKENVSNNYYDRYNTQSLEITEDLINFMGNFNDKAQLEFDIITKSVSDDLTYQFLTNPDIGLDSRIKYIEQMRSFSAEEACENLKKILITWQDNHTEEIKNINDPEKIKTAEKSYKKLVGKLCKKLDPGEISAAKNELLGIDHTATKNIIDNTINYYRDLWGKFETSLRLELIDFMHYLNDSEQEVFLVRKMNASEELINTFMEDSQISDALKQNLR